jgi:hypothetical protein
MIKMTNCRQTMHSLLLLLVFTKVYGWGNSNNNQDSSIFGGSRDWLYDGSSVSLKLEGCVWTAVRDGEDAGCLEESSEDGTTYWYQMSNCRRANAAFSLYSGNSCSSGNFEETVSCNQWSSRVIPVTQFIRDCPRLIVFFIPSDSNSFPLLVCHYPDGFHWRRNRVCLLPL